MHPAYKHLNDKLKVAQLTIGQWVAVVFGVGIMLAWGFYLCPFHGYFRTVTAVWLGLGPVGTVMTIAFLEIDLLQMVRAAIDWHRNDAIYAPGSGDNVRGYTVRPDQRDQRNTRPTTAPLDVATLWNAS